MDEMHCSNLFIHHPDEFVQNYMQPIDKIILMNQDRNTLVEDLLLDHGGTPRFMMPCCREDPFCVSIAS
jgi:hypothetical protein